MRIIGVGKGIPEKRVTNEDLTAFLDTTDEWIVSRTGVRSRQLCTTESMTDIASEAASEALKKAGLKASDIDLVIGSTISGDFRTPSLACSVGERIGTQGPAFDINGACAGFIYALEAMQLYLTQEKYKNILLVCCEMMSKNVDWTDRNICVLFGDGAGACVVTKGNALRYVHASSSPTTKPLRLPVNRGNSPYAAVPPVGEYLHMDGKEVFRFAVGTVEAELDLALKTLNMTPEQIDYFLLHQANKRIVDAARKRVGQPEEKFPCNMDKYGNISSATIPLLMHEMLADGRLKPGDTLFMAAFGAGLTFGSAMMTWE